MSENEFNLFLSEIFADFGSVFGYTDNRLEAQKGYDAAQYRERNSIEHVSAEAEYDYDEVEYALDDEWWDQPGNVWTDAEEAEDMVECHIWDEVDATFASNERWNIKRNLGE